MASKKQKQKKSTPEAKVETKPAVIDKKPPAPVAKPVKVRVIRLHRLDPWTIGLFVFVFAILFTLILGSAYALGYGLSPVKNAAPKVSANTQGDTNTSLPAIDDQTMQTISGERVDKREMHAPVAVMIDNHSAARPQASLQSASVIYETLVEGSITRFMAIFDHGTQGKIGPVRSVRPYFLQWADEYDPVFMHAGGSPEALLKIREYQTKDLYQGQYYWRTPGNSPHNLFTKSDLFLLGIRDKGWESTDAFTPWSFTDDPKEGATDANAAVINFAYGGINSLVRWEYDSAAQKYKRSQAGVEQKDSETGQQITAKTVIVQIIPPVVGYGDKGRLTLNIMGEGTAHFLFNGKRIEGKWNKASASSRTLWYDENGEELSLPRGNMFIEVVPSDRQATFE